MKCIIFYSYILSITVHGWNFESAEFNGLPEEKLLEAVCQSFYKATDENRLQNSCVTNKCNRNNTNRFNLSELTYEAGIISKPQLICKEDEAAYFTWENQNGFSYFLEVINENETSLTDVTTCGFHKLENLKENVVYYVRLWAVLFKSKQIRSTNFTKLNVSRGNSIPSPVKHIYLQNLTVQENSYDAVVRWYPNDDYSCDYNVLWINDQSIMEEEINVISDSYQVLMKNLNFDTNYIVDVIAINKRFSTESSKTSFSFTTQTCLEVFHTLSKCPPPEPRHLQVTESLVDSLGENVTYDIHISWSKPDLRPDYYVAHFANVDYQLRNEQYINISGNATTATFEKVELGSLYHISLMACSSAGCSNRVVEERHSAEIDSINVSSSYGPWKTLALLVIPLILVSITIIAIHYYRSKQKRKEESKTYFTGLEEEKMPGATENAEINLIKDHSDGWELDPQKLFFESIIGEGAFGIVRKANLEMKDRSKIQVAVKMLPESPTQDEIRQFSQEISIMKSVKQHPYIVSLIGCITVGRAEGPLLVVEYCSRGDLQTYLRDAWDRFCNLTQEIEDNASDKNYFANRTYDFNSVSLGNDFIIQPKHLLSIARQVAKGMEHLAKMRVVHRDLAARNVLVCDNHTVKVSDFGLSRDIYRDNVYCKTGGGKLPVRWMALESLTHQRYTTHSDVWSFGILLWEIVTLGGTPYVGVHTSDLLEFLKNGNRLPCPSNCSEDLYAIMQNCWKACPKNRPTFTEICKSLEDLLENVSQYLRLDNFEHPSISDSKENSSHNKSNHSNERYVKPINTLK